jgi:hypothetical protein
VNRTDELIATALRDIAEEARDPQVRADAAWRAGRRLRMTGMAAAAAAVAAAVAIAVVLLPGHAAGSAGGTGPGPESGGQGRAATTVQLRSPLELRQVTAISGKPCPPHSAGVPASGITGVVNDGQCFWVGRTGMTITSVRSAAVRYSPDTDGYMVFIGLEPSDAIQFGKLTTYIYDAYYSGGGPRTELAFIVDGQVYVNATVAAPITNGEITIACRDHASAERVLARL